MKVNTLCVVALGVGIGVDYGIYIFARMRESMLQGKHAEPKATSSRSRPPASRSSTPR